ncbi:MAG: hypothetical protein HRU09_03345 [Oligoflexales bacterium]|nr:hypothetical protein [Oligoflexales bacterium]
MKRYTNCAFFIICLASLASVGFGKPRRFLVTLPVLAVGSESNLELDLNLGGDASLAVYWSLLAKSERLTQSEIESEPGSSMMLEGQEFGFVFQRFSSGIDMSGFHWGIGAGYRSILAQWNKPKSEASSPYLTAEDEENSYHEFDLAGAILSARFGYRYVAESVGFVAGIYLKARHFQSRVTDKNNETQNEQPLYESPLDLEDEIKVKRRLMTTVLPTLELGWAF